LDLLKGGLGLRLFEGFITFSLVFNDCDLIS